jgi:hypothetical protein
MIQGTLLNQETTTYEAVLQNLRHDAEGTEWAAHTHVYSDYYAKHLNSTQTDSWHAGYLPKEWFLSIALQQHGHLTEGETGPLLFPEDTPVSRIAEYYHTVDPQYPQDCIQHINLLKEEIRQKGFTSNIVLALIEGKLTHIDGLHRIVALALLLEEGHEYMPIPVFLWNPEIR